MAGHYKTQCDTCDKIITQCRCPDPNKTILWATCEECTKKEMKGFHICQYDPPPIHIHPDFLKKEINESS